MSSYTFPVLFVQTLSSRWYGLKWNIFFLVVALHENDKYLCASMIIQWSKYVAIGQCISTHIAASYFNFQKLLQAFVKLSQRISNLITSFIH